MITTALLHLFGRQHGVASDDQLLDHLSQRQIRRARTNGLFDTELPGIRRLAGTVPSFASRTTAMSLFARGSGFVSGMTAARVHGVSCVPQHYYELMMPDRRCPDLPDWVRLTRTAWRIDADRHDLADGMVVASPLRTLFRCGATCSDVRFEKIAEQMWNRRLITPNEAAHYLGIVRRQGRHGVVRFERWLEKAVDRQRPSQSGLEVDLAAAIVALGVPEPRRQYPLVLPSDEMIHLDLAWPNVSLGVEPGATFWHGGDAKVRADHGRDRACDELGWRMMRYDEVELRDLDRCARQVVRIYRKRLRSRQFARATTAEGADSFGKAG